MLFRTIIKKYSKGSVAVVGQRGRGKDMLIANVIARRKKPYVSNIDYKAKYSPYKPLSLEVLDCGRNDYKMLLEGNIQPYRYPYDDGTDIYISDIGVYFPSQYCNELNRDYKYIPTFLALSRQLGDCSVHWNCQNLNRAWDKIREQGDQYIYCNWCKVFFGFVLQSVTIYERYDSCANRVPPFKFKLGGLAKKEMKNLLEIERAKYEIQHGSIKKGLLFYRNKSKYDTRYFKTLLEGKQ